MPNCSICEKSALARGLCRKHYYRVQRRGLPPLKIDKRTRPLKERLLEKVTIRSDGCWIFEGALRRGYPVIWKNRKHVYAHRISYELHCGGLDESEVICHHCDVPNCINPEHLFKGTRDDNNKDKTVKERQARGESHGCAVLTNAIVSLIFNARGMQGDIAKQYGVSQSTVSRIKNGKRWRHITLD